MGVHRGSVPCTRGDLLLQPHSSLTKAHHEMGWALTAPEIGSCIIKFRSLDPIEVTHEYHSCTYVQPVQAIYRRTYVNSLAHSEYFANGHDCILRGLRSALNRMKT